MPVVLWNVSSGGLIVVESGAQVLQCQHDVVRHCARGQVHHAGHLVVAKSAEPTQSERLAASWGQLVNPPSHLPLSVRRTS